MNNQNHHSSSISMTVRYFSPKRLLLAFLIISLWTFAIYYHLTHKLNMNRIALADIEDESEMFKILKDSNNKVESRHAEVALEKLMNEQKANKNMTGMSWKDRINAKNIETKEERMAERKLNQEAKYASSDKSHKSTSGKRFGPDGKVIEIVDENSAPKRGKGFASDPNAGLNTKDIEYCPFETKSDYSEDFSDIEPYLDTIRRDHYLINLSPFGPNNQLRGFRDTFILAILLNRTIVMPPFFKHRTDPSSRRPGYLYQDPQQKLDGVEMAKMVPVITLDQFAKRCANGLDVVFLARANSNVTEFGRLNFYEKILNFDIMDKPYKPPYGTALLAPTVINPRTYRKRKREESYVSMTKISAQIAYGPDVENSNDGPCAMWLEPYRNMLMTQHLGGWAKRKEEPKGKEHSSTLIERPGEMVARMMNATVRAKSVRAAVDDFLQEFVGNKTYTAMHWRYDTADFGKHCSKGFGGQGICGLVEQTDPTTVGQRIGHYITFTVGKNIEQREKAKKLKVSSFSGPLLDKLIYIAAPPAEAPLIETMKIELNNEGVDVIFGTDLMKFLEKRHEKCPKEIFRDEIHDFVSLVEMELCSRSQLFIYSGGSSWSRNILMERETIRIHKFDLENSRFMAKDTEAVAKLMEKGSGGPGEK